MKRITYSILFSLFVFLAGAELLQAQTYNVEKTWGFESGSLGSWAFAGAYQSGDAPTGGVITPTDFSAHGGTHVVQAIKGSGCWQINLQLDGATTIQAGDSLAFWVYPTVSDTTHTEAYQVFWQDGNWANWNSVSIPINMMKANQWNQVGLIAKSITAPLNRIGIQTYPKATHADSTAIDTIYIDDITVYRPVDPALVTQWGETSLGYAWDVLNDSSTAAGDASMSGTQPMSSNGASLLGGFDTLKPTMDTAVIASGQLEFVGSPGESYTALRFALTYADSLTLNYQYTDSAMWVKAAGKGYYGYEFTPRSGGTDMPNGSGGSGSIWTVINGNWSSTYSNGGGPIGPAINQAPRLAVITEGTYNWAISVQQVNDTTDEVRWSLVKTDNSYWFGGTVMAPAVTDKFNNIAFWTKDGDHTEFDLMNTRAEIGEPITIPPAPWQAYYLDQWGETSLGYAWDVLNDTNTVVGDAGIAGTQPMSSNGASLLGSFGQDITIPTDKAVIVSGQMKFVGSPGESYTALRYAITYRDSLTLNNPLTDSAMWVGSVGNGYYGYEFTPRSGGTDQPNGSGGVGSVWSVINGNWPSTYSNGGGPVGPVVNQAPRLAVIVAGTYDWAISVQQVNDTTNEVRWSLVKEHATGEQTTYWFSGTVMAPAVTNKLNNIAFWTKDGDHTEFDIIAAKIDIGDPITVPEPPFQAYYVDKWGFFGGKMGGWTFTPGEQFGNATISGDAPNTDWAALRGEFQTYTPTAAKPLKITGKVEFVGGGFDQSSSFRFGVFNTDSAGTYILDTASATLPDSTRWTGTDDHCTGYLFIPQSGNNGTVNWGDGNQATWGAVRDAVWLNPEASKNYALGTQLPDPSTDGAGTYDFSISVTPTTDGKQLVKFNLIKAGDYGLAGEIVDNQGSKKFNSIAFALDAGNSITAMNVTDVKIDTGTITGVNDLNGTAALPISYSLSQNYPNPFNPTTTIRFALPKAGDVNLAVYDILGRKIAELVHGNLTAGYHTVNFNASNLASGVYFYRIQAGDFVSVKKLMLLK